MKRAVILSVLIILTGCADARFYIAGYADSIVHHDNPKVLTLRIDQRCGQITDWVREKDAINMVAVCTAQCDCKLVKGPQPKPQSEICR